MAALLITTAAMIAELRKTNAGDPGNASGRRHGRHGFLSPIRLPQQTKKPKRNPGFFFWRAMQLVAPKHNSEDSFWRLRSPQTNIRNAFGTTSQHTCRSTGGTVRPPKNAWPKTYESRGVLMFAQLMAEMLTPSSFESFRVYSLDSIARLREALRAIRDVKLDRVPRQTLNPILEEIIWSLDKDPVVKQLAAHEIDALHRTSKPNASLDTLAANIRLISRLIGKAYKSALEHKITELLPNSKQRVEFRQTTGFYCSHLINLGYARPHILEIVNRHFFDSDLASAAPDHLTSFFAEFDGEEKKYTVFTAVSEQFGNYLKNLGFKVFNLSACPNEVTQALNTPLHVHLSLVVARKVEGLDGYSAVNKSHNLLNSTRALTYLAPEGMPCKWSNEMYVLEGEASVGRIIARPNISFDRPYEGRLTAGRRLRGITNYSKRILENFEEASTARLLNSIATSALARTSPNIENQLTSLWSSIEVLLSEPQKPTPRIVHYCEHLVPCICLRHVRRQFVAVYDELLISYRNKFNKILFAEADAGKKDAHTIFANALCLPENKVLQDQLLSLCTDNPLALHRIWKLHRDYGTPENAIASIKGHSKRVEWQIHRIYRARNEIVHSGRRPSYLESLIMNLSEYYRGTITTLVHRARQDDSESNIDQVVCEIGIEYEIFLNFFQSIRESPSFSREQFFRLIS
ncbi:MAG: hypothetical protein ACTHM2_05900 [Afipia sp.]